MKFNANQTMERAAEEYGLGKGQYFKVKEGANKIRLLSPCIPYKSEYKGQVNVKFPAWIIDRADGVIKLYFMPQTILNAIGGLQMSDDFGFEEVPMPYDLTIMAKGAGTKEVEYTVVGARNNTPLTDAEQTDFNSKPSIDEVVQKLAEKQNASPEASQSVSEDSGSQPNAQERARATAEAIRDGQPVDVPPVDSNPTPLDVEDIPF
jgi:hypothetical protein